jgi:hypothetical protein
MTGKNTVCRIPHIHRAFAKTQEYKISVPSAVTCQCANALTHLASGGFHDDTLALALSRLFGAIAFLLIIGFHVQNLLKEKRKKGKKKKQEGQTAHVSFKCSGR